MRLLRIALALAFVALAPARTAAASPDPASIIGDFHQTLLTAMKDAARLGFDGRYKLLEPAVDRTFDLPLMARIVSGARWNDWTDAQRDAVSAAFRRFVIATYARRFDGYGGEQFQIDDSKPARDGTLVKTEIVHPPDPPVTLTYLMRQSGDHPQAVDVFMTGTISELATRRSEFAAILDRGGYPALLKALDEKSQEKPPA